MILELKYAASPRMHRITTNLTVAIRDSLNDGMKLFAVFLKVYSIQSPEKIMIYAVFSVFRDLYIWHQATRLLLLKQVTINSR